MREKVVTLTTNLVLKTIKEALQKINLKIVKQEGQEQSSFHMERYFFQPQGHSMCKTLMEHCLDNHSSQYQFDFSQET